MSEEQILQEIERLSPHDAYIRGRCDMWNAINSNDRKEMLAEIEQILRNLEKAKSMTGRWIYEGGLIPKCSNCGIYSDDADRGYDNYCPNCGAKMGGTQHDY